MKKKIVLIISASVIVFAGLITTILIILNNERSKENNGNDTIIISFDSNGGEKVEDIIIEKGESITLPVIEKDGYNLIGWYLNGEKVTNNKKYNVDTTLVAKWEKTATDPKTKTFTVTFDSKGGSSVKKLTVECGKKLPSLSVPKRDGYNFVSWADKHGKVIMEGASLSCENITLYANWEKAETTPDPTPTPQKTYKCPTGYTLSGTKCTTEGTVREKCPDGTKVDGSLCIKTTDSNSGTRQCKEDTVQYNAKGGLWTGKGDYHFNGAYGKCAYYKWDNYKSKSECENAYDQWHKTVWVSDLNACYAEDKMNNYETVCSSDYQFYSSSDLSSKFGIHDNGKCLKKVSKTKYCDSGYTLTNSKCIKTIDATLE